MSWEEKFALDVWYVEHRSLALNARILAETLLTVVRRDGICAGACVTRDVAAGALVRAYRRAETRPVSA